MSFLVKITKSVNIIKSIIRNCFYFKEPHPVNPQKSLQNLQNDFKTSHLSWLSLKICPNMAHYVAAVDLCVIKAVNGAPAVNNCLLIPSNSRIFVTSLKCSTWIFHNTVNDPWPIEFESRGPRTGWITEWPDFSESYRNIWSAWNFIRFREDSLRLAEMLISIYRIQ